MSEVLIDSNFQWVKKSFKDVATFLNGRAYKAEEFKENGTPIVRIQNLTGEGNTVYSDLDLPEDKYINYGDLIYAWSASFGPYIWKGTKSIYHYHIWKILCNESQIDKYFFYYYLLYVSDTLKDSGNGTLFIHITKSLMESFEINLPTLKEQKAIASVLSSLDDKIDLLHRQNTTLERMAETLFRQWFIYEAQEGSDECTLDDLISVKGGTTPSTKEPKFWDGNIHWTSPRDLSNQQSVFMFDTERKITEKGLTKIGSGLLPIGTVLMSSRAPIGYLAITDIPVAINQGYIAIVCDKGVSNFFMYLWCKVNMAQIKNAGNGSTFEEISKSNFKELATLKPSNEAISKFDNAVEPVFAKIKTNQKQIQTLEKLRDNLLPKLMSGEVRVNA